MSFFRQRRPRTFNHRMLYVDERQERLRKIEERARHELAGMEKDEKQQPGETRGNSLFSSHAELRGAFLRATTHAYRRSSQQRHSLLMSTLLLLLLLMVMIVIWSMLIG